MWIKTNNGNKKHPSLYIPVFNLKEMGSLPICHGHSRDHDVVKNLSVHADEMDKAVDALVYLD